MIPRISTFLPFVMLLGCSMFSTYEKFDRNVWLRNNEMEDQWNPRDGMTTDLLENYLKSGLHRDSIVQLLGLPYLERIENRTPRGLAAPDSISFFGLDTLSVEEKNKLVDESNEWRGLYSQPDTLMYYPIGWSTIDPRFLIIKFNADSVACEFWIEQG
jgi:hypothetical protein